MKVFGLQGEVYRLTRLAEKLASACPAGQAEARAAVLARWQQARRDGLTAAQAAAAVGVPVATLYRWRKRLRPLSRRPHRRRQPAAPPALPRAVEALRRQYPMWGKAKLGPLLRAQGLAVSDSTVGRILRRLVERGAVDPVPALRRRRAGRRPARRYAARLPKGLKATVPGALVQLDTLTVNPTGERTVKQFTAYDPVARFTLARAFRRATSQAASQFLNKLLAELPFPVTGLQVDGGAEFMADFEQACQAKGIRLYVLPPKSPELNGGVERANGSWRYEFYACHDLAHDLNQLNRQIDRFSRLYNTYRPHGALRGLTPAQYLAKHHSLETPASHMC
jgi:transposase InsO family protein